MATTPPRSGPSSGRRWPVPVPRRLLRSLSCGGWTPCCLLAHLPHFTGRSVGAFSRWLCCSGARTICHGYFFIGGAFLRQDWLFLAVFGICLAKRGRMMAAGAALTWAALIRIFPAIILLGLFLKIVADSWQARRLAITAAHVRFAGGALLTLAVWLPLSLTVRGPDPGTLGTWTEFVSNTRKMAGTSSVNQVGLPVVLAFDPGMRSERVVQFWVDSPWDVWREGRQRTLHNRRFLRLTLVAGFLLLLALAARGRDDWIALTLGVAAIPVLVELSNYYYGILMAFACLWPLRPVAGVALVATALLSNLVLGVWTVEDDRYTAISVVVVVLVVCVTAAFAWQSRRAQPLSGGARTLPLTVVEGTGAPPETLSRLTSGPIVHPQAEFTYPRSPKSSFLHPPETLHSSIA